ncbi:MAG: response regulator [Deltaproteobacteria bacterium]|nr:response regulator [Deltaproteobacteria bacterium]
MERARRVLVVEDSDAMRHIACDVLEMEGFEVLEAVSGFDALKLLAAEQVDVVVTDINMPDLTGLELIKFCRSDPKRKDIPVIVISTDSSAADRERAIKLGANDYLVKPFEPDDLVAACRRRIDATTETRGGDE